MSKNFTSMIRNKLPPELSSRLAELHSRLHYGIVTPLLYRAYLTDERLLTRDELSTAATSHIPFGCAETFDVSPPVHTDNYASSIAELIKTLSCDQPFVYILSNSSILGPAGVTATLDGRYVLENSLTSRVKLAHGLRQAFSTLVDRSSRRFDHAMSLVGPRTNNYFHWMVDYLPKIQGLRAYEDATGTKPTLLIPPDPPTWLSDSIDLLGYADRTVEWTGGRARVDKLVVPTGAYSSASENPGFRAASRLRWLRSQITATAELSQYTAHSKYLYISREDAAVRRICNESMVLDALPPAFQLYTLSDLSLHEQIALFANAEIIIAPHGAGLTNILWGTDLRILELWGVKDATCYFEMSTGLGHAHSRLRCATDNKNLIVDIDKLTNRVGRLST